MKIAKIIIFILIEYFLVNNVKSQDINYNFTNLSYIFNLDYLPSIIIEISKEEWNKLLNNYDKNPRNEETVKANFLFIREEDNIKVYLKDIGFRIRGNFFSRKRPENKFKQNFYHHCHFKIDFDEYINNQNFYELKGLNLKWFNNDPTYIREIYCFDLFRRFGVWTACFNSYTRLFIKFIDNNNVIYFGIYEMLEPIDKEFIKKRFKDNSTGYLWKCLYGADMRYHGLKNKIGIEYIDPTDDKLSRRYPYDLKTQKNDFTNAKNLLITFISNLEYKTGDEFIKWVEKHIDIELFLKTIAINVLVGMWDDYWVNQNNFYIYFDNQQKMYFIPYDYDNTLGTSKIVKNSGTENIFNWGKVDKSRPLITKILEIPEYRNKYSNYILTLINPDNNYFNFNDSTNRIIKWHNLIKNYISNDTGEDMIIEDKPAMWGDHNYYRLLHGNEYGEPPDANFFKTRIYFAKKQLGLN